MKLSLNWLKDYIDIDMPVDELSHLLTMAGLEVEGIEPVGQSLDDIIVAKILNVELLTGICYQLPKRLHIGCRHMKFVGKLAHESEAHDSDGYCILDRKFTVACIGKSFIGDIRICDFFKHLTCVGSCQVYDAQCVGQVNHVVLPAVITGMITEPFDGASGTAGGGCKIIVVFATFYDDAVVNDTTVLVAHGGVLDFAVGNPGHVTDVNPL